MSSKTLDKSLTMDIEYVDILTEENLSSFQTVNMDLIYWSVLSSSRRGGNGVKEVYWLF